MDLMVLFLAGRWGDESADRGGDGDFSDFPDDCRCTLLIGD